MASSEEFADKAKEAFVDDDFETALTLYTHAISLNPRNANFFADCAQANIKLNHFTEAVGDANRAIELDPSMVKAYLRKGIACLKLEEYHTAKEALEIGASIAKDDSRFTRLIGECDTFIEEENMVIQNEQASNALVSVQTVVNFDKQCNLSDHVNPTSNKKYRHEFYQKPEEMVVTIFAKGIPERNVVVEFDEQMLSVRIDVPGDTYHFQPQLFGKVIPDKCQYQVLSTKVEVRLVKAEASNWASLEYNGNVKANLSLVSSNILVYPSSKPQMRDWNKFEAQVKKEELEEKLEGDEELNAFFQQIYKDGDEDSRRAMDKSFLESKGTVLSTDWKEVGSKKVECSI